MKKFKFFKKYFQIRYAIKEGIKQLKEYSKSFKKGNHWVSGEGIFTYYHNGEYGSFSCDSDPQVFHSYHDIYIMSFTNTINRKQIKCYREIIANLDNLCNEIRTNNKYRDSKFKLMMIEISEPGMNDYDAQLVLQFNNNSVDAFVKDLHILRINKS